MKNIPALIVRGGLLCSSASFAAPDANTPYSLARLQGGWWSSCDAPAVEFYIAGTEYSGDFEGAYPLSLDDDLLVFEDGFADGHSINVTHMPLAFRIVQLTADSLVLRPLDGGAGDDWYLQSCREGAEN